MSTKAKYELHFTKLEGGDGIINYYLKNQALPENDRYRMRGFVLGRELNEETVSRTVIVIPEILKLFNMRVEENCLCVPKFNTELKFSSSLRRHEDEGGFSMKYGEIEHSMEKNEQEFFIRILMSMTK